MEDNYPIIKYKNSNIQSDLLILPEELRDKIFSLLPISIQMYMIMKVDPIYVILDPFNREKKLNVNDRIYFDIHMLCRLYGLEKDKFISNKHIENYISNYNSNKDLYCKISQLMNERWSSLRCNVCKRCISIVIFEYLAGYNIQEDGIDLLIINQIKSRNIGLLDIYDTYINSPSCVSCSSIAKDDNMEYYYYYELYRLWEKIKCKDISGEILLHLITNTEQALKEPLPNKQSSRLISIDDPRYISVSIHLISTLDMLRVWTTNHGEIWQRYYNFVKYYSKLLEYSLVWPELIKDELDSLSIFFITKEVTESLLYHFCKGNDRMARCLYRYVVSDLIRYKYPTIIFNNTIITYVSKIYKSKHAALDPCIDIYKDILTKYREFINT